ncbi:hypothetical protein GIB67_026831 [Kingdonia uniflora]|uniref:Uncharacterized protein n=1 Tax=Kingdonia uniflora TaxID=39325 RepID=A0A7J7MHI0_9MAGN|nr:hypothetical protein GIB67_026831 [Kingdonia uniflora]
MCIAVFVWQSHPIYPFLLLLNRDEYHKRPTKPIYWWEGCEILGGRDEIAGGTWLACTRDGRLAFLTNVMESPPFPEAKSRGDLPVRFLKSTLSPKEFAQEVIKEADQFNGFNLMLVDICSKTMVYVSNRPKGEPICVHEVSPGIHVLSNEKLDSTWPKAQRLNQNFKKLLDKDGEGEITSKEMVEELMTDTVKADESRLPGIRSAIYEMETSSIFVGFDSPEGRYGTRSTALLCVKASGEVSFYEKYIEKGKWIEHTVDFTIEKVNK